MRPWLPPCREPPFQNPCRSPPPVGIVVSRDTVSRGRERWRDLARETAQEYVENRRREAVIGQRFERPRADPSTGRSPSTEIAYAIPFLASDEASYITGSEIHVDGGALAI